MGHAMGPCAVPRCDGATLRLGGRPLHPLWSHRDARVKGLEMFEDLSKEVNLERFSICLYVLIVLTNLRHAFQGLSTLNLHDSGIQVGFSS